VFLPRRIFEAVITGVFLSTPSISAAGDIELWRLDLGAESRKVGPEAFPAWMEQKGFQAFNYLFFKRRPAHWRIGPCDGDPQSCNMRASRWWRQCAKLRAKQGWAGARAKTLS